MFFFFVPIIDLLYIAPTHAMCYRAEWEGGLLLRSHTVCGALTYKHRGFFPPPSNLLHRAAGSRTAVAGGNSIENTQAICYNQLVCACAWIFVFICADGGLTVPDKTFSGVLY